MNPVLKIQMERSSIPFEESAGGITTNHTKMHSWRYFLEINSVCNLHCPTCTKGNQEGYEHQTGVMDPHLMGQILDKIAFENPSATVLLYGNSEPFLHPQLAECIIAIHKRGLRPEMSTNLNRLNRVYDVLYAKPDLMIISLSGFTQEVYVKGHAGGNIERVKENMRTLAEANNAIPETHRVKILVNYHVYNDNEHEIAPMKEYATNLGLGFFTSLARAISMENAIQYCRAKDLNSIAPFKIQDGKPDCNQVLPPSGETYEKAMQRLKIPPTKAREMYRDIPESEICPVGAGGMFTFIRHDGQTSLCACTADRRLKLTDYLDTTPEQFIEQRVNHSFCKECKSRKLNMYFHLVDRKKWENA